MKIRAFIALELPLPLRQNLSRHAKQLSGQDKRQHIRWLPPGNYHLTLVFLGDVDSVRLHGLQFALELKLESMKAVPYKISAISPFPFSHPKIVAALLECTAELRQLQTDVVKCVRSCGISWERRRFVPHVTLGRLKPRCRKSIALQSQNILFVGFVNSVTLFQSELTPNGAIHTVLAEIPLRIMLEGK